MNLKSLITALGERKDKTNSPLPPRARRSLTPLSSSSMKWLRGFADPLSPGDGGPPLGGEDLHFGSASGWKVVC